MSQPSTSRRLGKYRVLKELGRGSFGITSFGGACGPAYEGGPEGIDSQCRGGSLRDRFIQEARVQAKLSARHAGIAQVTELEEDANPPYYVVEYCDQGHLATLSQELGPWPVGHVVWLIRQVADALSYARRDVSLGHQTAQFGFNQFLQKRRPADGKVDRLRLGAAAWV